MKSFREKWEFPLSQIIEIITLWSPDGGVVEAAVVAHCCHAADPKSLEVPELEGDGVPGSSGSC